MTKLMVNYVEQELNEKVGTKEANKVVDLVIIYIYIN